MAAKTTPTAAAPKAPAKAVAKPGAVAKPSGAAAASTGTASKSAAAAKPASSPVVTLKHLAATLSDRHDMPRKQAETMLSELFSTVVDHLKEGERVRIGGLGIIEVKNRPARMGRNPATGAAIQIKASKKVAFRAAKELKDAI